jgi:riboflavin kinase/FMN adenylyltransferase
MKVTYSLSQLSPIISPCSVSIGVFDGLHLGHQKIISLLGKKATKNGTSVLVSFTNNPLDILSPEKKQKKIYSLEYKLYLMSQYHLDFILLFTFSKEFALMDYGKFLSMIHRSINFKYLILGKGASFGKNKEGKEKAVLSIAKKENFSAMFIEKQQANLKDISSSRIREAITTGNLILAKKMLGRDFSLFFPSFSKEKITKENDLFVINFLINDIILPPSGIYEVIVKKEEKDFFATIIKIDDEKVTVYFFNIEYTTHKGPFIISLIREIDIKNKLTIFNKELINKLILK